MKIHRGIVTFLLLTPLFACHYHRPVDPPQLDRLALLRSMTYTQQRLLDTFISGATNQQVPAHLMHAYCDLIKRKVPPFGARANHCPSPVDVQQNGCVEHFYLCIGSCGTSLETCHDCEEQLLQCVAQAHPRG